MSCSSILQPKGAAPAFASFSICLCSLGSWITAELCRQAGSHRDLSLSLFPHALQLCSFGWAYPAPRNCSTCPGEGKEDPKRLWLPRAADAPLYQLELWLSWRNSHSSPEGRRGLIWSPEMHQSHPLIALGWLLGACRRILSQGS